MCFHNRVPLSIRGLERILRRSSSDMRKVRSIMEKLGIRALSDLGEEREWTCMVRIIWLRGVS